MRTSIFLLALLATALAVTIEQQEMAKLSTSRHALQFNNYSGAGVTNQHITAFTNFANSASSFYKDDVEANAKYIKKQMDTQFGAPNTNFFVIIQTERVRFSWLVWITNENVVANLAGINKVYPDWSYMFVKFIAPTESPDYAVITPSSQGAGIDDDWTSLISSVVNTYESGEAGDACTCDDFETQNIGYGLINGSGRAWSTICDATGISTAYVYAVDGLWISAKPKNCYYTLYVSQ